MTWTLENIVNGVSVATKSLADWGLDDLKFKRDNLAAHVVTLLAGGRAFDAAELFPRDSTVIIRLDNVIKFYGRVDRWARSGVGAKESQAAEIINPWWYLAKKTFQHQYQSFTGYDGSGVAIFTPKYTARVLLNVEVNSNLLPTGALVSLRDQVTEIINYAIAQGAPIALGTVDGADIYPESEEVKMITCAEAITKQWRWANDFVLWWDYTTTPYPTVHFRSADNLTAKLIDLNAGTLLESFNIEETAKVPYVVINYEASNGGHLDIIEDHWPDPLPEEKFGGVDVVLDVQGQLLNNTIVTLKTEAVAVTAQAWWKKKLPWLSDPNITSFTFVDKDGVAAVPTVEPTIDGETLNAALTYELLPDGGSLPEWSNKIGQSVRATGWVNVVQKNFSTPTRVPISYEFTATNATSGDYNNITLEAVADPIPTGLARKVYESYQRLGAQGSLSQVETELTGGVTLGDVVNFTSTTQPGWAALRAIVQSVEETVVVGRTSIRFGTRTPLGFNDLSDILRMARVRQHPNVYARSGSARPKSVVMGRRTPAKNSQSGLPAYERLTVNKGTALIDADPAKATAILAATTPTPVDALKLPDGILPYEIEICDPTTGAKAYRIFLCGGAYTKPA